MIFSREYLFRFSYSYYIESTHLENFKVAIYPNSNPRVLHDLIYLPYGKLLRFLLRLINAALGISL